MTPSGQFLPFERDDDDALGRGGCLAPITTRVQRHTPSRHSDRSRTLRWRGSLRYERRRGREIPLADGICRDDLCLGIERNEGDRRDGGDRRELHMALLLTDIAPDLINLDTRRA